MEAGTAFGWLAAAGAAIWLGIGAYLAFIAAKQRSLALRLRRMEQIRDANP